MNEEIENSTQQSPESEIDTGVNQTNDTDSPDKEEIILSEKTHTGVNFVSVLKVMGIIFVTLFILAVFSGPIYMLFSNLSNLNVTNQFPFVEVKKDIIVTTYNADGTSETSVLDQEPVEPTYDLSEKKVDEETNDLQVSYDSTYRMDGFGGAGFFDGESFVVQELTLKNETKGEFIFVASDLRLKNSEGSHFFPVSESAVGNQPRFKNPITVSTFPSDLPDTHYVRLYPNEELEIAVTFYVPEVPADSKYSILYKGGDPVVVTPGN